MTDVDVDLTVYDHNDLPLTVRVVAVNRNERDDLDDAATLIRQVARGRKPTFTTYEMHRLASACDDIGMRWDISNRVAE